MVRHIDTGGPPDGDGDGRRRRVRRELIRSRCVEGIERAKAKGTRFGRKSVLGDRERKVIVERYAKGETMARLAIEYNVGEATIWRALH